MSDERFSSDVGKKRILASLDVAEKRIKDLNARKDELEQGMPSDELGELLSIYDEISSNVSLASQYADALFGVDTQSEELRLLVSTVSRRATDMSTELLWFTLSLKDWPKDVLQSHADELPKFSSYLMKLAKYAPHTLSESEEKIISLKDLTGADVVEKLYSMITSDFSFEFEFEGEVLELTRSGLSKYFYHEDRAVRKRARDTLLSRYQEHEAVLSEIYSSVVSDWDIETVELRGHESPIHARHLSSQITHEIYSALQSSMKKNIGIFRRYVDLKRKALGYDEFTQYDFTAPVPGKPEEISYEESKHLVLGVFEEFAPWMHEMAKNLFDEGRIDAKPRKGKRGGACCYPIPPRDLPLVILNHADVYDDMFTMAHELGHAIHNQLSHDHPSLTFHPPITLAETASQFAEMLLFDAEMKRLGEDARISLLCHRLDDFVGSIVTQTRYVRFEQEAHQHIQEGGSAAALHLRWSELIKEDFPAIDWPEKSEYWLAIPHIFQMPFYCYSYAFGMLLVLALYKQYQKVGPSFSDTIRDVLSAGGTVEPAELLSQHGLDLTSASFWDDGFAIIEDFVDQLEQLLD